MEAHIPGIGVENFRIFEKEHYFNFAPITLLTGANSSGKSSLIKALKFMHEVYGNEKGNNPQFSFGGNRLQYTVGEIEKVFTQNKTFDFYSNPLKLTANFQNDKKKECNCSFFQYHSISTFGSNLNLQIKYDYEVNDKIIFKNIKVVFNNLKPSPLANYLDEMLFAEKGIRLNELCGKELIDISIGYLDRVKAKINIDILFFIFKTCIDFCFEVYKQKQLFESKIKSKDDNNLREEINNYFLEKQINYKIVEIYEGDNSFLGIVAEANYINFFEQELEAEKYNRNTLSENGVFAHQVSLLEKWLENDHSKINQIRGILVDYYGSKNNFENEKQFTNSVNTLLTQINWSSYLFLQVEEASGSASSLKSFEEFRFNSSFVNFSNYYLKRKELKIDSNNEAIFGFSLHTLFNFLKQENNSDKFEALSTIKKIERNVSGIIDKGFIENLLTPFFNILLTVSKSEIVFNTIENVTPFSKIEYKFHAFFLQEFFNKMVSPLYSFKQIQMVTNERSSSDLFFKIKSEKEFNTIKNFNTDGFKKKIIVDTLKKLEIADDIFVEMNSEENGYKIILTIEKKEINLFNLGYGITKLLPLIITINPIFNESSYDYHPTTVIIEEPESNLHPALQSKLADMFVELSKTFNIQFIIETHSEYLIRKFQYLTAKKVIEPKDTQIHYFYHPDKVPLGETQTYPINITKDGSLTRNFGKGFFDEADNIAMELFLLKMGQKN